MSTKVVVLGSGYAGTGAVKRLEEELDSDAELTWVSENDYHLVLHEAHRCIRDPSVESKVAIPVDEIKEPETEFVKGHVENVDVDGKAVELEDGEVDYDYLLVCLGSATAFYGIEGLEEHSLELKSLDDAREIHSEVKAAAEEASEDDPAKIIVGGAGLSGIQSAGEIAGYRDDHRAPLDITIVEGLDEVFPGNDRELQGALRKRLEARDIDILTGDFISKVDEENIYLGGGEDEDPEELDYDVLLWTGGITGQKEVAESKLDKDERSNRIFAEQDFKTSDDDVFALGDSALVEQGDDAIAPPTAQAAWQAAEVAGENVARATKGQPLKTWDHKDKGTVISVGEDAVAHAVKVPGLGEIPPNVFGGPAARTLKKGIAARWIADVTTPRRALEAWDDL
ncbi:FAD-dependent oxidoreductase [Halogeometricum sp. S1BR25-6]|uniref:FAD-dependent oxidoreductase n=1 Tax=Halogeometricum salsisoli TaxID=2950536 RepID=A0ABU2GDM1_9EURY|nr:FAD-dependent oxidoreductase [Halogeometricum sp. S1BR25-6]MDS0298893.1 FAD-dependent oxidoreductase [Halogeometricum sp. S1BR25-6]